METEPKIIQSYIASGKVKFIYRHMIQIADGSVRTAEASECAADQGAFWAMRYLLYARQPDVFNASDVDATLVRFASDLKLDTNTFAGCLKGHEHLAEVQADYQAAQASGVRFQPTFDLAGERLTGALPFGDFQQRIDAALAK